MKSRTDTRSNRQTNRSLFSFFFLITEFTFYFSSKRPFSAIYLTAGAAVAMATDTPEFLYTVYTLAVLARRAAVLPDTVVDLVTRVAARRVHVQ